MPVSTTPQATTALTGDLDDSLLAALRTLPAQPCHHARHSLALGARLLAAWRGEQQHAWLPGDSRFGHPDWQARPCLQRSLQAWLSLCAEGEDWLQGLQVSPADRSRLALLGRQLSAALAPSNTPLNPEFRTRLKETGGRSLFNGLQHLAADLLMERPLAPLSDDHTFQLGRDLACTPGRVVQRQPLFELIQYQPRTPKVHGKPLLIIPPPLNRFYLLDLTPTSSLVRHALEQGLQVFLISWRNPTPEQAEWGFNQYVGACLAALDTSCAIAESKQAMLLAVCAGGVLGLLLQGLLQARNQSQRLSASSYLVTPLDARLQTDMLALAGPAARQRLRRRLWRQGCLQANQLGSSFAWLRPEHFVWPMALQRYGLDQPPPAREVLFWSQDNTRLPARLVEDMLDLFERDPLAAPGHIVVQGAAIDLSGIQTPSWHLGAQRDHIVNWQNSYPGSRLGGDKVFVQSHSGHIQSLINPLDHPGARFRIGPALQVDAEAWLTTSTAHEGSWWPHWSGWLKTHAGRLKAAPAELGNTYFPPLDAAPGRYVYQS